MSNLLLLGAGGPVSAPGGGGSFTVETATYDAETFGTSFTIPMPSGSGGRLLMAVAATWTGTVTTPTDWTQIVDQANGTGERTDFWVFERDSTGFTDTTVGLTIGANDRVTAITFRIGGSTGAPDVAGTPSQANSTAPDPPSLTPAGGSALYLWIALVAASRPSTSPTYPSGYTDTLTAAHATTDSGSHSRVMAAWKEATASSEDPGVFGLADTVSWVSTTIAYEAA